MHNKSQFIKNIISPEKFYNQHFNNPNYRPTGNDWNRLNVHCPFHNDEHIGTFHVNFKTGAYKCFSCGAKGGDIISFYMNVHNVSFQKAIADLLEQGDFNHAK